MSACARKNCHNDIIATYSLVGIGFVFLEKTTANKMKDYKNLLGNLGSQIDILNTLGGGISMTQLNVLETTYGLLITVRTATISGENYHIEIQHNNLYISSSLKINSFNKQNQATTELTIPAFTKALPLPDTIDTTKTEAIYEDGELKIILPFKSSEENEPKQIKIKYT